MITFTEDGALTTVAVPESQVRVALLAPQTGPAATLGRHMVEAAQLALFEIADSNFQLMPYDTGGTPDGAAEAARQAVTDGAQLILGPLFAASVEAVKPVAEAARVNVVAFSNSVGVAGGPAFIIGFTPRQQVDAVVSYVTGQGLTRFAILAPHGTYGEAVVQALRDSAGAYGGSVTRVVFYDPNASDFSPEVKSISDYDRRHQQLLRERARAQGSVNTAALARLERLDTLGEPPFDAILLPETGQNIRQISSLLAYYDVDQPVVRVLGLRIWDEDPSLGQEPAMVGAWFAAPALEERYSFIKRFADAYGHAPARLASLAYDATAMAATLAADPAGPDLTRVAMTNPFGFVGVDGLFRLGGDGVAERAFAILEIRPGGFRTLHPAPKSFEPAIN